MKNTIFFALLFFLIIGASCLEETNIDNLPDLNVSDQNTIDQVDYIIDDQGNLLEFHDFEISLTQDQG